MDGRRTFHWASTKLYGLPQPYNVKIASHGGNCPADTQNPWVLPLEQEIPSIEKKRFNIKRGINRMGSAPKNKNLQSPRPPQPLLMMPRCCVFSNASTMIFVIFWGSWTGCCRTQKSFKNLWCCNDFFIRKESKKCYDELIIETLTTLYTHTPVEKSKLKRI